MGEGDFAPRGGHRKKAINPKKLKAMKEQWKKAPKIREKAKAQHEKEEVPKAEEELLKDLSNI
ncbi:hypothetical protein KKA33_01250 [Patescibacteria group bacterium]|nr:hypothetical protein [Patescibacteria group bacterium]